MSDDTEWELAYWKKTAREAMSERDEWRSRAITATTSLPEEMEHCTIRFRECALGHGWLTADNWVQHDCPTCTIQKVDAELQDHVRSRNEMEKRAEKAEDELRWLILSFDAVEWYGNEFNRVKKIYLSESTINRIRSIIP